MCRHSLISVTLRSTLIALLTAVGACTLPADMGKSQYVPSDRFCQCGNYKTALDAEGREGHLGGPCHCPPALGATTGTIVAQEYRVGAY
jgi:hypothetical protein